MNSRVPVNPQELIRYERSPPDLPQHLTSSQLNFITKKTPSQFIRQRPGPGGMSLSYVEVGYVINVLNQVFGWDWDFRILDQQVGKKQVWVRGELTVRSDSRSMTKGQFGGADIKMNKLGIPISVADDLKTAASDCLKKCASLLGIASDIYWRDLESWTIEGR